MLRLRLDGGRTSPRAARDGSSLRGLSSCEDDNDDADISLRHTPPPKTPQTATLASVCTTAAVPNAHLSVSQTLWGGVSKIRLRRRTSSHRIVTRSHRPRRRHTRDDAHNK